MNQAEELITYLKEDADLDIEAYGPLKAAGDEHLFYVLSSALKKYFELALLFWRKGDMQQSFEHFSSCTNTYNQMVADAEGFGSRDGFWKNFWEGNCRDEAFPAAAAYLSGVQFTYAAVPEGVSRFEEEGFRPWFNSQLVLACMGHSEISKVALARSIDLAKQNSGYATPLIKLTEFHFEALTGQWSDRPASDMLDKHSELYAGLKKLKGDPDLIHGEKTHNERVVDWIFACVLKRIGWSGRYLHAWPRDGEMPELGDVRETFVEPRDFVILV